MAGDLDIPTTKSGICSGMSPMVLSDTEQLNNCVGVLIQNVGTLSYVDRRNPATVKTINILSVPMYLPVEFLQLRQAGTIGVANAGYAFFIDVEAA